LTTMSLTSLPRSMPNNWVWIELSKPMKIIGIKTPD
jgi:hypothetical protein